jgi:hypothetical protein
MDICDFARDLDLDVVLEAMIDTLLWTDREYLIEQFKEDGREVPVTPTDWNRLLHESVGRDIREALDSFLSCVASGLGFEGEPWTIKQLVTALIERGGIEHSLDGEHIGYDLILTANHHGAGFWDRGHSQDVSDILTDSAHSVGSLSLVLGDSGQLYCE